MLLAVAALAYFIPAIAAGARRNVNAGGVFVVNLFLGWTVLGWVIALAMAFGGARRPAPALSVGQRSEDGRWWWDGQQWRPLPPP